MAQFDCFFLYGSLANSRLQTMVGIMFIVNSVDHS
jgi:hypothetical protein